MARKSQVKGRRGELELAALLQQHGYDVRPGEPLNCGQEADIVGLPHIHCEVKRCQQLRLSEWMRQASDDAEKFGDGAPTIFFRRNREAWRVIMNLPDWLALYERAMSCKCGGRCSAAKSGKNQEITEKES